MANMTQNEMAEYIHKLEEENNNNRLKYEARQTKMALKQSQIAFVTSFITAQMTSSLFASLGLCKRNDK